MAERQLVLYHYTACPYCQRVRSYLAQRQIALPERNIREDAGARQELIAAGGKAQVPALMIDGQVLYESAAIIRWLEQHV